MAGVWTNNWQGCKNLMLMGCCKPGLSTIYSTSGGSLTLDSVERLFVTPSPLGPYWAISGNAYDSTSFPFIVVGTGASVAPGASDYCLVERTDKIKQLSVANGGRVYDTANGTVSQTVTLTLQNNSADATTLTEWGIFVPIRDLFGNVNRGPCMVYHDTFSTPVTLAAYEAATLELTVELTLDDPI